MLAWECSKDGLDPQLVAALEAAAEAYCAVAGGELRVTSGRRTLWRQAELMAAMTDQQLQALYASHGMPDYITAIITERGLRNMMGEAVYGILCNRREGYISAHLFGAAVDLATAGIADLDGLKKILAERGFSTLDERDAGIPCLHCRFRTTPTSIVRE